MSPFHKIGFNLKNNSSQDLVYGMIRTSVLLSERPLIAGRKRNGLADYHRRDYLVQKEYLNGKQ